MCIVQHLHVHYCKLREKDTVKLIVNKKLISQKLFSYLVNYVKKEKVPNKSFCVSNNLFCIKSLHKSVLF